MSINIYDIDRVKRHKVFYEMVKTFTKEITNCGRFEAEAGATGIDNSRVYLGLKNLDNKTWEIHIDDKEFSGPNEISLYILGEGKYKAVIEALEFMLSVLKEADKHELD